MKAIHALRSAVRSTDSIKVASRNAGRIANAGFNHDVGLNHNIALSRNFGFDRHAVARRNVAARSADFSTSTVVGLPSDDPGGKPNTGQHRTVYDDFFNILESSTPTSTVSIASTSGSTITLQDGLVLSEPLVILNNQVFLFDHPRLNQDYAVPSGLGWEDWIDQSVTPGKKLEVTQKVKQVFAIFELVDQRPEIILFGTGKRVLPPPSPIRQYINDLGIQLDVQSTHDAASTYNMLTEEGRKVAAILIPAEPTPRQRFTPQQLERLLSGKA